MVKLQSRPKLCGTSLQNALPWPSISFSHGNKRSLGQILSSPLPPCNVVRKERLAEESSNIASGEKGGASEYCSNSGKRHSVPHILARIVELVYSRLTRTPAVLEPAEERRAAFRLHAAIPSQWSNTWDVWIRWMGGANACQVDTPVWRPSWTRLGRPISRGQDRFHCQGHRHIWGELLSWLNPISVEFPGCSLFCNELQAYGKFRTTSVNMIITMMIMSRGRAGGGAGGGWGGGGGGALATFGQLGPYLRFSLRTHPFQKTKRSQERHKIPMHFQPFKGLNFADFPGEPPNPPSLRLRTRSRSAPPLQDALRGPWCHDNKV